VDDLLVERWRKGDPTAATAVRNAIRSVGERVLADRALRAALGPVARNRLRQEEQRREITATIAAEVMRRPGETANQVKAAALMAACRVAVEGMQEGRAASADAHLPPPLAVTFALAPGSVVPRMREAAERHLGSCGACREDVRIVDAIVRNWDAADTEATRDDIAEAVEDDDFALPPGMNLAEIMREALDEQTRRDAGPAGATAAPRAPSAPAPRTGAGPAPRASARDAAPVDAPRRAPLLIGVVVLVAVIGAGAFALRGGDAPITGGAPNAALRPLAVRDVPELPTGAGLPSDLSLVATDLQNNDCRTAAGRARQLRLANPGIGALQLLEGAAFVCAGDGAKAVKALEGARSEASDPGRAEWLRAQAFLLEGRGAEAVAALKASQAAAPDEAVRVRAQLQQVEDVLR
jgi:hypothetical protein